MPFFQGATDFEVNGGTFQDIGGNQINKSTDKSFNVQGNDNTTKVAPNHSQTDNRAFYSGNGAYSPMHGQQATYPGYGQTPPSGTPGIPMQSAPGEDQDPMLRKLKALYRLHWVLASQCHAAILAYQGGQQPPQHLLDHFERSLGLPQQQQQPSQLPLPQQYVPRTSSAPPVRGQGEETPDMTLLRERLERQHIQNPYGQTNAPFSMSATQTSHHYLPTRS